MGYSASGGPKGLGTFNSTPQTVADLTKLVELIARMGNYRGAVTASERDLITGGALYNGLLIYNTTDGTVEIFNGSAWVVLLRLIRPMLKVVGGGQSCANSTFTTLTWTSAEIETVEMWSSGTNIVIPVDGIYRVSATAGFTDAGGGRIALRLRRNGSNQPGGALMPSGGVQESAPSASTLISFTAGDVLTVQVFQDSGGARTTSMNDYARPVCAIEWIGPA